MLEKLTIPAIALLMLVSGCKGREAGMGEGYVVSIEPQRWVLEQLADSGMTVSVLMPAGSDPETYEPTMAQRTAVAECMAYFGTGTLPFEERIADAVEPGRYHDTSAGAELMYGTHGHDCQGHAGHEGEAADPHYWTSASGARQMARNMAEALTALKPDNATAYAQRLSRLEQRLDSIDGAVRGLLGEASGTSFAVWHPSLSYFARDYSLHQIAVGQEGKDMSARQVREAIDLARGDSVRVFFIERQYDTRQAEAINAGIGSRLVEIEPLAYDWDKQIIRIADELARP